MTTRAQKTTVSTLEASSSAAWGTGRAEVTVTQALPTAESIDSANRTTTAMRPASTRRGRGSAMDEHLGDPDRAGTDHDDEEDREDADQDREDDLHGDLLRLLLRALTTAHPQLARLLAEHAGDGHAEPVRLDQGGDERLDLVDVAALGDIRERLHARAAELNLLEHPGELRRQRPRGVVGPLPQAGVEAQAGLDAESQPVKKGPRGQGH